MNENNNKIRFLFGKKETKNEMDATQEGAQNKIDKLKKPIMYALMGVVFVGCMHLIFKPSSNSDTVQEMGLNDAVPQASDAGLQSDKQKAYEQELLEQKMQDKRNTLLSLSD